MAGGGVHDHVRRFVHHQNAVVFEHYSQRQRLGRGLHRRQRRQRQQQRIARANLQRSDGFA